MKPLIWLVEDEPSIADTLIYTLKVKVLPSGGLTGGTRSGCFGQWPASTGNS